MGGEFGIGPVDPRIVKIRAVDTGLKVNAVQLRKSVIGSEFRAW
jgi:hypothetical protein